MEGTRVHTTNDYNVPVTGLVVGSVEMNHNGISVMHWQVIVDRSAGGGTLYRLEGELTPIEDD